jgi:replication factor A1
MYDFESLVAELLQSRPELNREELMRRIEDKKQTVGAGYLTDQGALFLVAGELGVSLRKEEASADMSIKDLYVGANDVTVVGRVLAVYPEAMYNKKAGGTGKYRRMVLFDGAMQVRLTAWEEKSEEVGTAGLEPGAVVRVVSAYVKQGLDGRPNLNLGTRGRIEVVTDVKIVARLPSLSAATEKLGRLSQEKPFTAIECVVNSEPRFSEFTRSDGSQGSLYQFGVAGEGTGDVRVVIWNPSARPELRKGQKVTITNVRARRSNTGDFEVHGDTGSVILLGPPPEREELRVASVSPGAKSKLVLGLDRTKRVKTIELGTDVAEPSPGDVVGLLPDSQNEDRFYCRTPGSLEVVRGDSFPTAEELVTKLKDAKGEGAQIMVEVIALSQGSVDDVHLRDGSTAKKGELVVGDDTDEIKIVAWRDLSGRLTGIQPGERLRVIGAAVKPTSMGASVLQISNLTVIERIRGR